MKKWKIGEGNDKETDILYKINIKEKQRRSIPYREEWKKSKKSQKTNNLIM